MLTKPPALAVMPMSLSMALDDNQPEALRLVLQMEVERYHLKTLTVMERSILET